MPRKQPTARQRRLGQELRRLREAAGLTARQAAESLGTISVTMSQIESGVAGVSEARVRRIAAQYTCTDTQLIDALVEMATERVDGWWEEYRDILPPAFLDLAELEYHATFVQEIGTAHVTGPLQTEDYARAVFTYWRPELPASELEARVAHRMHRKAALARDGESPYTAVLHESVLRTRVADRRVARAQLDQLLRQSERPGVTVRVIPFDVDGFGVRVLRCSTEADAYRRWTPYRRTPRPERRSWMRPRSFRRCEHSSVKWSRHRWSPPGRGTSSTVSPRSCSRDPVAKVHLLKRLGRVLLCRTRLRQRGVAPPRERRSHPNTLRHLHRARRTLAPSRSRPTTTEGAVAVIQWQKSTYSGGAAGNECVELADSEGELLLRESESPTRMLPLTPITLAALLHRIREQRTRSN